MCRKFVLYMLVVCCQSVFAEPISFSYNSERDSLTFTGEGSLEQKHVKQALAKYPRTKIVYVGGNVDHVGDNAFNNCNNLETIIFSPSVRHNGTAPISNCKKLSKVVLPDNFERISNLLVNCPSIESFVIPDSVREIEKSSTDCPFKTLHIGKNFRAFQGYFGNQFYKHLSSITVSPENKYFSSQDGVLYYYSGALGCDRHPYESRSSDWYFMNDLKRDSNSVLELLIYPPAKKDTFFEINTDFDGFGNKYLKELKIGHRLNKEFPLGQIISLGRIDNLERILVDSSNTKYHSENGVLYEKGMNRLVRYPTRGKPIYVIPEGVTSIGDATFSSCSIEWLSIPSSVKEMGNFVFFDCKKLKTIQMNWKNLDSLCCDKDTFRGYKTSGVTLKVPKGTKGMYRQLFNVKLGCKFTIIEN